MVLYHHTKKFKKRANGSEVISKGPFLGHFCPIWAKREFSPKIWLTHFFTFMDFYLHAKFQKKISNGSPVMTIWRILQSDWSRASSPKTREPEFSYTCEWCRLISYNMEHISGHFQPKLMTGFWNIIKKVHFWAILGTFCPIWAKRGFSRKIGLCHFFCIMNL